MFKKFIKKNNRHDKLIIHQLPNTPFKAFFTHGAKDADGAFFF